MTDLAKLNQIIDESGMTKKAIAEKADIPLYTLERRLSGVGEITVTEALGITRALTLKAPVRRAIFGF